MMNLPIPDGPPIRIPEVGGMLMVKTRNDTIFNLIDGVIGSGPDVFKTDRAGFRMRTFIPPTQTETSLRPAFAQTGDYLFLASNSALIEEALAVRAGSRPGLKTADGFKRLSQGVPAQGNAFTFISPKVGEILTRIQTQALEGAFVDPAQRQMLSGFFGSSAVGGSYSVAANTDEGWISVGNTTRNPTNILTLPLTMIPLIISSAIPSLTRSRQSANESAAIANLRTINTAEVVYYTTSNKYADIPALVKDGLLDTRFLEAVSGYRFEVDTSLKGDYLARAVPVGANSGRWGYYSTSDGVVRYSVDPALAPPEMGGKPVEPAPARRGVVRNEPADILPSAMPRTP
jgi:competence protein ComGC